MSDVYLWETYEKVGREAMERRDFSQAIESFKSAVTLAERLPGEEHKLVMSLRHLSSATAKSGQLSLGYDLLKKTEEIAATRLGTVHSETVQAKRELYEMARQLGFLDQAEAYLADVLAVVRAQGETEEFLEILQLLAQLAGERERMEDAAALYAEIVEARSTLYGEDDPSVAQALLWHSTALSRSGQGEAAEAPLSRAFALLEQQFAEDPKNLAQSLLAGADLMSKGGRPQAALEHQKRALDLLNSLHEESHPSIWDTREMIGATLANLGRLDEAIEVLEYCLQNRGEVKDHRTAGLLKNLAGLYLSTGRLERAEELYSRASDLLHQTLGPDHPASLAALEERIQLYHFSGRPAQALELALSTIKATELRYGPGHPNTAQVYASTAMLAHAAQKWDTSYELMKAAEAVWETLQPRPDDVLANCRVNQATCLVEMGRGVEALAVLDRIKVPAGSSIEPVLSDLKARALAPAPSPSPVSEPEAQAPDADLFAGLFDSEPAEQPAGGTSSGPAAALADEDPLDIFDDLPDHEPLHSAPAPVAVAAAAPEDPLWTEGSRAPLEDPFEAEARTKKTAVEESDPPEPRSSEEGSVDSYVHEPAVETQPEIAPEAEVSPAQDTTTVFEADQEDEEGEDRRVHRRFNLGLNRFFDLSFKNEKGELYVVRSFLVDLSAGGLRLNSERPLPQGEVFELTLPPELLGESTTLRGRVTWQRPLFGASYIQGVKFLQATAEQKAAIERALGEGDLTESGRQHYRLYRPFPISLSHAQHAEWLTSYASDLSLEGVGTRLPTQLSTGDPIRLRLSLEFELPTVEVAATVAWSRSGENGVSHGLRFEDVGPVEARTIRLYIDRCLELSPD